MFIRFDYGVETVYLNISTISRLVILNDALTIHVSSGETYDFTEMGAQHILDTLKGYIM